MYVLCYGVMLLFFYCTAHMYSCTVYSSWGAHGSSVREWPPWDQNIVSPRTQILQTEVTMVETRWPAMSASASYWYISTLHTIMNSVLQLAFLVCGMDLILIIYFNFICNYFIFPSLYKYWHCSCPQCIIGFPSLSPSSELQLFLSNLTGWQYYIWVSGLSLLRLIMENIQLFSQY